MTTKHWLGTAAIILAIGTGASAASAQSEMKREGGPAAASPRGEAVRPAADAKGGAAAAERAASETKGAPEQRRAEPPSAAGREPVREQAQERAVPDTKQGAQQTKGERGPAAAERARDAKEGAEDKQAQGKGKVEDKAAEKQPGRADERKTEERAAESNKPGATDRKSDREADRNDRTGGDKPRQSQDERGNRESGKTADKPDADRSKQATQPARVDDKSTAQQDPKAGPAGNDARKPDATGQAGNQTQPDGQRSATSVSVNDQQRTRVVDQLKRDRDFDRARTDIDIRINIGERLPERVRPRPLPSDIVVMVPEYRGYDYTVVRDEIAIIDPRSREIVDVIPQNGVRADRGYDHGSYGVNATRIVLSDDQRQILRRAVTETGTVGSTTSSSLSSGSSCLSLRRVPDELARSNPELANYQYLAIGDQVVLVDPRDQKIVQVIDQQQ
ncbi:hypothetical protein SSBR45G_69010 [Bradyrhizobium sp. SSBR45G]|uniref:DUF1236 domain-containing protein n=1 Tax=unclassified Bradyrhizobium TaxID=2631580 RepID=UPI002342AD6F|nr:MULTISPECIES: DUF1236 domain-containing protein [unclassified Bradyrhizobium]GLH81992.1 hypothetical protein SSBR45G_69010 [Bradyrhizobium sp. SSBR45G]GLH85364.1 hypothetical protein SSBR45R_28240 [Bradyrhizobium sp. SSBR45R]